MITGLALLARAALDVPLWEYALLILGLLAWLLYHALDFHFFEDLLVGFRGHPLKLIYNPSSPLVSQILPHCHILKQRYMPTPWLCSPHLQTAFLHFFGWPPQFNYHRQLLSTPDGGTIALDWLCPNNKGQSGDIIISSGVASFDETCTAVVIPGLTSCSDDAYVKLLVQSLAASGWRVVVANHRGLGGVSITSDQFYSAGWTEDLRRIIELLHQTFPKAPIFAVGTSLGANILVKYLGEEGQKTPLLGAAAICCPWDLLVCDRFMNRKIVQRMYNKVLALSLRSYAQLHQEALSRIADWEVISKTRCLRDFDNYCTRLVGQYETVDTYYRKCSSAFYLHSVAVPIFCISSLDDPVCTKEAIPWDECRFNPNVVLVVARHGGHLGFFEGLSAKSVWWVRSTMQFLENLRTSSLLHKNRTVPLLGSSPLSENPMDKSPFLSACEFGLQEMPCKTVGKPEGLTAEERDGCNGLSRWDVSGGLLNMNFGNEGTYHESEETDEHLDECVKGFSVSKERLVPLFGKTPSDADSKVSSSSSSKDVKEGVGPAKLLSLEYTVLRLVEQVELLKQTLQEEGAFVKSMSGESHVRESSSYEKWLFRSTQISPPKAHSTQLTKGGSHTTLSAERLTPSHDNQDPKKSSWKGLRTLARQSRWTLWLLAYISILTTWPLLRSALLRFVKGRLRKSATKL